MVQLAGMYDVLVALWGNTRGHHMTVGWVRWFKEGENSPCYRSASQTRPGYTYFQFVYSWRPNCQFLSICFLASNFNSLPFIPSLPPFHTPKSTETVESVQNAFNEISSTRAYFVQRHSRITKKPCTAVNTAILKQHYQDLIKFTARQDTLLSMHWIFQCTDDVKAESIML